MVAGRRRFSGSEGNVAEKRQPSRPRPTRWPDSLVTLAIETSCDDTCVAVLEKEKNGDKRDKKANSAARARLLFEERITADNRAFGGIHPLTATESHMAALAGLVQRATAQLPGEGGVPDVVTVTRGPGMASSLAVGLAVAKGLAVAWRVPLVGVHHMQAHALTPRLVGAMQGGEPQQEHPYPPLPYLSLLVSGGHTLLLHSRSLTDHRILAAAANIAVGDLLDKCARAILPAGHIAAAEAAAGRSLPYGALLEGFAWPGGAGAYQDYAYPRTRKDEQTTLEGGRSDGTGWRLDAPLAGGLLRRAMRFDYSGLNGTVLKAAAQLDEAETEDERRALARGTMQLAFEHLASRLLLALESLGAAESAALSCVVVAGGVASNGFLRHVLRSALDVRGFGHLPLVAPPVALCTDNAAMIAWAGLEMFEAGWQTRLDVLPLRKWSMDPGEADGGILGTGGWDRRDNH